MGAYLDCLPSQVTALLDGLVASGHLERSVPPDDRWVRSMSLTEKSRRIVDEVVTARLGLADWLFKGFDDELQGAV